MIYFYYSQTELLKGVIWMVRFSRENLVKKIIWILPVIFVLLGLWLFTGCSPLPQEGGFVKEVSQTGTLKPEDPAYAVALLTDNAFSELINDFVGLLNTSSVTPRNLNFKTNIQERKTLKELLQEDDEVLDSLIDFVDSLGTGDRKTLMEKMVQFRTGVDNLSKRSDRLDYLVEIKDPAKTKVVQQISNLTGQTISTPAKLYMDFRDVMFFRIIMEPLMFAFENRIALREGLVNYRDFQSDPDPSNLFVDEFLELIDYILYFDPEYDDLEEFAEDLAEMLNTIADLKDPKNELDMLDIFKEDALKIRGMDLFFKSLDFGLFCFVELYEYEDKKTNNVGRRSDGKETIMTLTAPSDGSLRVFKPTGDEKPFEENTELDKIDFKFGNLTISKNTTLIQILRELDEKVPNGSLIVEIKPKTGQSVEDEYTKFLLFRTTIDFQKLNKPVLDFKDNNLGILEGLFNVDDILEFLYCLEDEEIIEALDFIDPFIPFYELEMDEDEENISVTLDIKLFGKISPAVRCEIQFEIKDVNSDPGPLLKRYLLH